VLTALGIAAAIAGVAGAALASIPDSNSVIHGCYVTSGANLAGGTTLKIVNNNKASCLKTQTAVTWPSGPQVLYGAVSDTGSSASFYLGGHGMHVSEVSTGVTKLSIPGSLTQPVISVTAVAADSSEHCGIGSNVDAHSYDIDCFDQGNPWPVDYHVIAIP